MNKKIIILFIGCIFLIGCNTAKQKEELIWKISEREVSISLGKAFDNSHKDVFVINIPIEFDLNINHSNIKHVKFYYKTINETYGSEGYHYVIYNGDTGNPIFEKGQWGYPNYPHSIYILDRRFIINDEQVNNLLKAYKINRSIDDIKRSKDTIHLTSYDKFRKEYPNFIQKMDVVPDSLFMRVVSEKGEIKRIRKKIEW